MSTETGIEWTAIPGFPGYSVTRDGHLRGVSGKVMRQMTAHRGHKYIIARRNGRGIKLYTHTAILLTFVGPCPDGQECRHLDGKPANNVIENLRWGTPLENSDDKRRHGTIPRGSASSSAKLTEGDVLEIRRIWNTPGRVSLRELGARFGVSHTAIRRAATGAKWSHIGASA